MNKLYLFIILFLIFCVQGDVPIFGGGPGDDPPPTVSEEPELPKGWVYGFIEYEHDIHAPNHYFMLLRAHPEAKIPAIQGGYATTDVYAEVRLRGVSVPRALNTAEERHRPHPFINQERARWNTAMQYVWNLAQPNKIFRVGNFAIIDYDKVLLADIEFMIGKVWMNMAQVMINDEVARAPQDEFEWDWGSRGIGPTHPSIPR